MEQKSKLSPIQSEIAECVDKLQQLIRKQIAEEVLGARQAEPPTSTEEVTPADDGAAVIEGLEEPDASVVRFVWEHPGSSPAEIAAGAGLSRGAVKRPLTRLVESGRLIRRGRTRSIRYFAKPKGATRAA